MLRKEYVKNAVKLAKELLFAYDAFLPARKSTDCLIRKDHHPEIGVSPKLGQRVTIEYQ